jgi:hypothetical protein
MCESVPEKYFSQNAPAAMLHIAHLFISFADIHKGRDVGVPV